MVHLSFLPRLPYTPAIDITELISLDTVVKELNLGPNGGLVYCIEYLEKNVGWLVGKLSSLPEDNYVLFDLPGQVCIPALIHSSLWMGNT